MPQARNTAKTTVLVIGLDCLAPDLVFDRYAGQLPALEHLMEAGAWGRLRSVDPPVTVPAWACMTSGCAPSRLGLYGFRHRRLGRYHDRYFATSEHVRFPRIWDLLAASGRTCGLLGVPQTWPVAPVRGFLVSDFLTPSTSTPFSHPPDLGARILARHGRYRFDVEQYRTADAEAVVREIRETTTLHFEVFKELATTQGGDFLMMVEMGPDRMHHALFRHTDPSHPLHDPRDTSDPVLDYYRFVDTQVASLLQSVGAGRDVFIVSDHGAQPMLGGFRINQWLLDHGHLALRQRCRRPRPFDESLVDFGKTRAWAWGGHHGRIFVNLRGREPDGVVSASQYEDYLATLTGELEACPGPDGRPLGTRVVRPVAPSGLEAPAGDYPDLLVYPGDLRYRAVGTVGGDGLFTRANDTGPDDANHAHEGVLIHAGPGHALGRGELHGASLLDIAPTVLHLFGVAVPDYMDGRSLVR